MTKTIITLALATVALLGGGCLGNRARDQALSPAIAAAWPGVKEDALRGIELAVVPEAQLLAAADSVFAMDKAVASGDRAAVLAVDFTLVRAVAALGIQHDVDAGLIGPGVGLSLVERLDKFAEALAALQVRVLGVSTFPTRTYTPGATLGRCSSSN